MNLAEELLNLNDKTINDFYKMEESLVKINLAMFVPALVRLIGASPFPWKKFDELFNSEVKRRIEKGNGEPVTVEATLYDIIIEAKKENNSAIGLLHFLNRMFEELSTNLNETEKAFLRKNISDMLGSMTKEYLNYVGEIATLNNLIKTKAYRLEGVEEPMGNGKTIDFKLAKIESGKVFLVEIVNIHIDSVRVETDTELIHKFFSYRLQQKIDKKMYGLSGIPPFYLIPVLWGGYSEIKIYGDFFGSNKLNFTNVIEPVSYLMQSDGKGYFEHYFKSVSNLFSESLT